MGYSAISNAEIDPESPSSDTLMEKYRDNLLQVEEWIKDRIDDMVVSNWKAQTPGGGNNILGVWYNEDTKRWVFVAQAGVVRYSDNDGIDWTAALVNPWAGGDNVFGVHYNGSNLWACCGSDSLNRGVATSIDGDTWNIQDAKLGGNDGNAIVHNLSDLWVVVGQNGKISSSPDGTNWTARVSGTGNHLYCVCFAEGLFVVGGVGGTLLTSPNGTTWTSQTSGFGAQFIHGIAHNGSMFVAVGGAGKYATSADGITWSAGDTGIGGANDLFGVHYSNGRWVAVGSNGILITSPDGTTWTKRSTVHGASTIWEVARNGGPCFMVVGDGPKLSTSLFDPNRNVIP